MAKKNDIEWTEVMDELVQIVPKGKTKLEVEDVKSYEYDYSKDDNDEDDDGNKEVFI